VAEGQLHEMEDLNLKFEFQFSLPIKHRSVLKLKTFSLFIHDCGFVLEPIDLFVLEL
jgi:hypothetical protein